MKSNSSTVGGSMRLLTLGMTFFLAACSPTLTTLTGGTSAGASAGAVRTERAIASDVCRAWPVTPYSSRDTPETQLTNRANNASRAAYCQS